MTHKEKVEEMAAYTGAVLNAWDGEKIYMSKNHHSRTDGAQRSTQEIHPEAVILLNKWLDTIDRTDIPSSPKLLFQKISDVNKFLELLA